MCWSSLCGSHFFDPGVRDDLLLSGFASQHLCCFQRGGACDNDRKEITDNTLSLGCLHQLLGVWLTSLLLLFLRQGERVWLWEDEQYLPSTVSSCSGGVVVFATDYGQVGAPALKRCTEHPVTSVCVSSLA